MKDIVFSKSFINLKLRNAVYVDKTKDIFYMLKQSDRIFLSRPRRFGKSLTLDTIGTLFEFGVDPYFKDTWIYSHWQDKKYPVFRLSLVALIRDDFEQFTDSFCEKIREFAEKLGICIKTSLKTPADYLEAFFSALPFEQRIVLLIDEYDCMLTHNIDNASEYHKYLNCLRSFYGVLKDKPQIRFLGITGVTRLKNVSIFSVGSDIIDLTYKHVAATVAGYTREEIATYFKDYLDVIAQKLYQVDFKKCPPAQQQDFINKLLDRMALEYDGYCFDEDYKQKVFSTWSVSSFLNENFYKEQIYFGDYWFENGGVPSILVNYLNTHEIDLERHAGDHVISKYGDFVNPTSLLSMDHGVLMCQTGYLTLRSRLSSEVELTLGIPNNEIRKALYRLLFIKFTGKEALISSQESLILKQGNASELLEYFNTILNTLQYDHYIAKNEAVIQEILRFYLLAVQQPVCSQKHSAKGRSDLELEYNERRLVIELKYAQGESECEKALHEAVEQIRSIDYGNTLPLKEQIYRVALVFDGSAQKRCFTKACEV